MNEEVRINEVYIRFSGSVPTDREFGLDEEVDLTVKVGVVKIEERSNQDGSLDRYIVVKPIYLLETDSK